jgi:hypothetical protein
MINIELENKIITYISNKYRPRWISLNTTWKEYLLQRWPNCNNIKESYLRIKYNIIEIPKCPICGNDCKFHGDNWIYDNTCGNKKCQSKLRNFNSKQTKLERYGDENFNNAQKIKQTKLERYGDENYNNSKQASINRDYKLIQQKIQITNKIKYGITNVFQINKIKQKIKQTKLERYGDENYLNRDKIKQTKLERYGDENYLNRDKIKQTKLERYGDENYNNQQKIKDTFNKKYNVDHNWKIKEIHDHCWDDYTINKRKQTSLLHYGVEHPHQSQIIQEKIYQTKRKNHTFNTSKIEIDTYNLLKEKYPDVIYQYKDKQRYPFICDFYIPSLDLFIECNYHWTHGGKPYEGTINDNKKLQEWKDKNTKYYNNAITTWIVRDVNKRNIAKQNKLNWIEFFSLEELKEELLK